MLFFRFFLGFCQIFLFYLFGEIAVRVLEIPFPGTLVGLLGLLIFLLFRKRPPVTLLAGATPLLKHMAVLFVPAVLGVGIYWQQISDNFTGIGLAIVVSTTISLGIRAWFAQRIMRSIAVESDE